jgi:hypothetical protein
MLYWLIGIYALLLVALTGTAGWVALFATDHRRGTRAYTVLKTLLAATVGGTGLLALAIRLHQAGLL